ncbi:unnamed protein product [Psylliodes chrysocephalus]|uniref:YqaJ viral recombinase domain-containing protein n=1 Tax=Psylliodes chrysocephalus TaxID=3402493 RepID=A0A9P0GEC9_9CUCU|nr:unnamed protein product [Psylliodes chrysocephala]
MNKNELTTKASYLVTEILARKMKPFSDAEVVKEYVVTVCKTLFSHLPNEKPRSVSTNSSLPVYLRKEVEKNSKRLIFAISKATKYRIEENTDFKKKIVLLKRDILNAPSHVFGEHAECEAINYFKCDRKGTNFVILMKECGFYRDILVCLNRLILNIESLIHNLNNNLAEHYNSINFSKRNSCQTRCEAAVISFNKGAEHYDMLHKAITGNEPNTYTKKYLKIIGKRKLRFAKLTKERKELFQIGTMANATQYGKLNEPFAVDDFEAISKHKVKECGLFIDKVVDDNAILEIKCPLNIKDMSPEEDIRTKK